MINDVRKDIIMVSTFAGAIGSLARAIFSYVFYLFDITQETAFVILAKIIYRVDNIPMDFAHIGYIIVGLFAFIVFGSAIALGLSYIYLKFGTKFYMIKGILYGVVAWLFVRNIILDLIIKGNPTNLWTPIVALISHIIYGTICGYIIVKYGLFIQNTKDDT